ncbi:oligopeptide transporter 2 [Xylariaceae sp. FL0804]|nr:oligopeptide transporter 2 [Xylariaceae sp. FL0804]
MDPEKSHSRISVNSPTPPPAAKAGVVAEKTQAVSPTVSTGAGSGSGSGSADGWAPPAEWLARLTAEYEHAGHTDALRSGGAVEALPPGSDPARVAAAVLTLDEAASVAVLRDLVAHHQDDYTIDRALLRRAEELASGPTPAAAAASSDKFESAYNNKYTGTYHNDDDNDDADKGEKGGRLEGGSRAEWAYEVCRTAGVCHNWSPYPEVRAVTLPYDDPAEACESVRAYVLGFFWVIVCTAINTFFAPRQPGISIPNSVPQLLLVPMGRFMAMALPDWGFTLRGTRYTLNPGPWTQKEQLFATIIFSGATTIGNFTGLLVMRLPVFFDQRWVGFGFAFLLALANQGYGLGMAGILRRLTVYPIEAVWPGNLPLLALNRTLISPESPGERIGRWRMSRFRCFAISSCVFLVWYWIPNEFFGALRLFNWMTWIAPNNFNLATVTGSYGGMGFNPWSSFDPNVSGTSVMSSPFFAQLQQYVMRAIAGVVIIIMYYSNAMWTAFLPINSNGSFDNTMAAYNVSKVLDAKNHVVIDKYKAYGPPYYGAAQLFVTGANFVYYAFSVVYIFIRYWKPLKKAFVGMYVNTIKRRSIYTGFEDGHTRMMRRYKEVPEWWYAILFAIGFVISIVCVTAWPTETPWYAILAVTGIGALLTIPWVIIESIANTGISLNVIWQLLPGVWWAGSPLPQLVILMLGGAFEQMAGGFTQDLKYAHYARIPPRAVFRGHVASVVVNCLVYCAILEVMLVYFNQDATLCQWDNKRAMVCQYANQVFASTIFFGAFGTNNMFRIYPALPWCFLVGGLLGLAWVLGERFLPRARASLAAAMDARRFAALDRWAWAPAAQVLRCIHPAIALSGGLQWAGNMNLTYATLGIYLAWLFQYRLKRRHTAWWSKYAYLVFAGLGVGVAVSGLIVTLVFSFGAGRNADLGWWGNNVATKGVDYQLYNNNASLLPLPSQGYFGLAPEDYPLSW